MEIDLAFACTQQRTNSESIPITSKALANISLCRTLQRLGYTARHLLLTLAVFCVYILFRVSHATARLLRLQAVKNINQ